MDFSVQFKPRKTLISKTTNIRYPACYNNIVCVCVCVCNSIAMKLPNHEVQVSKK